MASEGGKVFEIDYFINFVSALVLVRFKFLTT